MTDCLTYCQKYLPVLSGLLLCASVQAQQSVSFEVNTQSYSKRGVVFNSSKDCDSIKWKARSNNYIAQDMIACTSIPHESEADIILYESEGSVLAIDTTGRFYLKDVTAENPKRIYLDARIDTLKLGRRDIVLEADNSDLVSLEVYTIPLSKYGIGPGPPLGGDKITFKLEEIIYGAKGKVSPRILEQWATQIKIDPESRNIIHEFKVILPRELVKKGTATFMIYDLSYQVVRIYPNLNKTVNILRRDNIATGTYIYKIFFNGEEELKRQMLRFLSPEEIKE